MIAPTQGEEERFIRRLHLLDVIRGYELPDIEMILGLQ
jgi:hypothetical protein